MTPIITFIALSGLVFYIWKRKSKSDWILPTKPFSNEWRIILIQKVAFYNALSSEEKNRFEFKVQEFLLNCRITGIETTAETTDKILVASSAIIPIFGFTNWKYSNINEVLIYPNSFNKEFETEGENRQILGMVGTGYMDGIMILSQQALQHGFKNESDKKNTAIHEFVHLIDKTGGVIDGIPSILLEKQYSIPWIDLINKKIDEIYEGKSDINPYGGTNKAEFFSVISEYFFERPKLLQRKHPELYDMLEKIFNQDMSDRNLNTTKTKISRNSLCLCNSGKKFKKCCGKVHYN
jgi:Mlc titration factor MtfA (ptsG expression regulator)